MARRLRRPAAGAKFGAQAPKTCAAAALPAVAPCMPRQSRESCGAQPCRRGFDPCAQRAGGGGPRAAPKPHGRQGGGGGGGGGPPLSPGPAAAPTRQRTATACTVAPACGAGPPRAPRVPGRRQGQQQDGELWRGGSGRVGRSRGRQGGAIPPQSAACGSATTPGATWAQAGIAVRGIGLAIKGAASEPQ